MKNILLSIIFTLFVLVIVGMIYIYSGSFDVSQTTPHTPLTQWLINKTMHHSIEKRVKDITVPDLNDTTLYLTGARHYDEMCAICHGAPDHDPSDLAEGLYPKPPRIQKPEDIVPTAEAFWIIKNGIKLTGMPAYGPTHTDEEIWAITGFIINKMVKMSSTEYNDLLK